MLTERTKPLLADLHIDALALDWARRARLQRSPIADFNALVQWDARLVASFRALLLLAGPVRENLVARLKEPLSAKEVFVLARFALARQDDELIDTAIGLAQSLPAMQEPLLAALAWQGDASALGSRLDHLPPALRLRIHALDAWRLAGQPERLAALQSWLAAVEPTPETIEAVLQLVRCLGDRELAASAANHLDHANAGVRLAAARTLASLADAEHVVAALPVLETLAQQASPDIQESALQCLALHAPLHAAALLETGPVVRETGVASPQVPEATATQPEAQGLAGIPLRLAIKAHGWIGRIGAIPFLMSCLDDPAHARQAGAAISLITGSDPHPDGWHTEAPSPAAPPEPDSDRITAPDPDAGLPWPSRPEFVRWWTANRQRFDAAQTCLYGQPATPETLARIVREGPLPVRDLAAERLQRMRQRPLFPLHLPAHRQQAFFATLL